MTYSDFIKRLRVRITKKRTGIITERNLFALQEVCTGDDFENMVADLRDSGISEDDHHLVELL